MNLDAIRSAIEEAVSAYVGGIQLPGIIDAEVRNITVSSKQLQRVSAQLEQRGHSEITLSADVRLILRFSNTMFLPSIECTEFSLSVDADADNLRTVASSEKDWAMAWERGIEPIKQAALPHMKDNVRNIFETLAEDSYTFQAAMVLLASAMVGTCAERAARFLGYPVDFVQVIAARLIDAKIWEGDEVHCDRWYDPQDGGTSFMMDLMIANGQLIRKWSEEKKQYAYRKADIRETSQLAI